MVYAIDLIVQFMKISMIKMTKSTFIEIQLNTVGFKNYFQLYR